MIFVAQSSGVLIGPRYATPSRQKALYVGGVARKPLKSSPILKMAGFKNIAENIGNPQVS
jgi:hypothetical protein